jgi:hypothetical protein
VLEEARGRGTSLRQFAAEAGLGVERLYRWKRRLERGRPSSPSQPAFAEVTIRPGAPAAPIEIELPGGIALRLGGEYRVEDAVALLSRLR